MQCLQSTDDIPILHPSVLVLTKIKRMVHRIGSARPNSLAKFRKDEIDVVFLFYWLLRNNDAFDFDGYASKNVEKTAHGSLESGAALAAV